jgi:Tol biopolymer transport system component
MRFYFLITLFIVLSVSGYSALHQLTDSPTYDTAPCWSPDGTKIAFESDRTGHFQIWVMNADGSNQHNVSNSAYNDRAPSYSPDGSKIAFSSDRTGNCDIYKIPATGGAATRITSTNNQETNPTWSPDGLYIAYNAWEISKGYSHIWEVDANGGIGFPLTSGNCSDMGPRWSPIGHVITFYADGRFEAGSQVCIMSADGQNIHEVVDYAWHPSWSPDGTQLTYASYDIYIIPARRAVPQQVTFLTNGMGEWPAWSPDSSKIAFGYYENYGFPDIWTVDLNPVRVEPSSLGQIKANYK